MMNLGRTNNGYSDPNRTAGPSIGYSIVRWFDVRIGLVIFQTIVCAFRLHPIPHRHRAVPPSNATSALFILEYRAKDVQLSPPTKKWQRCIWILRSKHNDSHSISSKRSPSPQQKQLSTWSLLSSDRENDLADGP